MPGAARDGRAGEAGGGRPLQQDVVAWCAPHNRWARGKGRHQDGVVCCALRTGCARGKGRRLRGKTLRGPAFVDLLLRVATVRDAYACAIAPRTKKTSARAAAQAHAWQLHVIDTH